MKVFALVLMLLSPFVIYNVGEEPQNPKRMQMPAKAVMGEYFGEEAPDSIPKLFASGIISSPDYEHGSPSFSPDGNEVYWSVRIANTVGREQIRCMKKVKNRWSAPFIASFSGKENGDLYPTFSYDGKKIYFTSDRPLRMHEQPTNRNIWVAEKKGRDWLEPAPVGFDSLDAYGISIARDGTLYFMAQRSDKIGSYDLYRSRLTNGQYNKPERLRDSISTEYYEDCPFIAPDDSYLLFESNRPGGFGATDFYISYRAKDGSFTTPKNLGNRINTSASERFAYISSGGKYFFFGSNRTGNYDIYWIKASFVLGLTRATP